MNKLIQLAYACAVAKNFIWKSEKRWKYQENLKSMHIVIVTRCNKWGG